MNEKAKTIMAVLGDFSSVLILPLFALAWWCIQTSITLNRTQSESSAKDSFVAKAEFQATISTLTASDVKHYEKEAALAQTLNDTAGQINLKLQHLIDTQVTH